MLWLCAGAEVKRGWFKVGSVAHFFSMCYWSTVHRMIKQLICLFFCTQENTYQRYAEKEPRASAKCKHYPKQCFSISRVRCHLDILNLNLFFRHRSFWSIHFYSILLINIVQPFLQQPAPQRNLFQLLMSPGDVWLKAKTAVAQLVIKTVYVQVIETSQQQCWTAKIKPLTQIWSPLMTKMALSSPRHVRKSMVLMFALSRWMNERWWNLPTVNKYLLLNLSSQKPSKVSWWLWKKGK